MCGSHISSLQHNLICNGLVCWPEWVGSHDGRLYCLGVVNQWLQATSVVYPENNGISSQDLLRPPCSIYHIRIFGSLMPCWPAGQRPLTPMSWRQRGDHDEATHLDYSVSITFSIRQWSYWHGINNNYGILLMSRSFNNTAHPTHDGLIISPSTLERSYHLQHSLNHTQKMFPCSPTCDSQTHQCSLHMQYVLVPMCTSVKELGSK